MRTKTRISNKLMRLGTLDAVQPLTRGFTLPLSSRFETGFEVNALNPLLYFDAKTSMLNANGDQAGFLESVATLDNLTGGPDATEGTVERRPNALPLIDGKGYLYTSGVTGNYAEFDEQIIPSLDTFELEIKFYRSQNSTRETLVSQYGSGNGRTLLEVESTNRLRLFVGQAGANVAISGGTVSTGVNTAKLKRIETSQDNYAFQLFLNGTKVAESATSDTISISAINTRIGELHGVSGRNFRGTVMSVKVDSDVACDFTDTSVAHGASSFDCSTGQTVTISKSGLDPSLLLRRPVLRFDGASSTNGNVLVASLTSNIDTAHSFIKFAVNADSGYSGSTPIVLSVSRSTAHDYSSGGARLLTGYNDNSARSFYNGTHRLIQNNKFKASLGPMVVETSLSDGSQFRVTNSTDKISDTASLSLNPNRVYIGRGSVSSSGHAPIDVEQIILFDRVVDEADANDLYNNIK